MRDAESCLVAVGSRMQFHIGFKGRRPIEQDVCL